MTSSTPATTDAAATEPVEVLYRRLAPAYDLIYGLVLHPGRRAAIRRMALGGGERVLEIGVGTGLSAVLYPPAPACSVVAVDVSREMLARAAARLQRRGVRNVDLVQANATSLQFDSGSFDVVYAPYVINVVSAPMPVAREMRRVCRAGGRIVFLNHFRSDDALRGRAHDLLDRTLMAPIGVRWNLRLSELLETAGLELLSLEPVNVPRFSSLAVCRPR